MTEEKKEVVEKEAVEEKSEEEVEEKVEAKKESAEGSNESEAEEDKDDFSVFVTEDDLFDIIVRCQMNDGKLLVEEVDEDFDKDGKIKEITFEFKRPSQGDLALINTQSGKWIASSVSAEDQDVYKNLMTMEYARLLVLVRSWNLKESLTTDAVARLDPKIVKSITNQMRDKIGLDGII
jgi:hypothetical protein